MECFPPLLTFMIKAEADLLWELCIDLICESFGELVEWRGENVGEVGLVEWRVKKGGGGELVEWRGENGGGGEL